MIMMIMVLMMIWDVVSYKRKTGKGGNFFQVADDFDDYDKILDEKDQHMMTMIRKERIGREVLATKLQ